jgi:branched-chain amino acid transport system permease protein
VVSGCLGLLLSLLIAKMRGAAVLTVTLCTGLLLFEGAGQLSWLTGGDTGLQAIEMWPLFGRFEFDLVGRTAFWYAYGVTLLVFLLARRYIHSPEGLALLGIRENQERMAMLGVSTVRRKMIAFTISGTIAGVAGALIAQTTQIVALETLSLEKSVSVLVMLIVGGLGTLIGGFIGAAAFIWVKDALSVINPVYWVFWLGLILIANVSIAPTGLIGAINKLSRIMHRRKRP